MSDATFTLKATMKAAVKPMAAKVSLQMLRLWLAGLFH